MGSEKVSYKLLNFGVYIEKCVGDKWCFKKQFPGQGVIIVSGDDKEKTANIFFIEYLKSLHYSIRLLYENDRKDELKTLINKQKSFNEPNINKTIEIITRGMNF